jgi:hypothetical protein
LSLVTANSKKKKQTRRIWWPGASKQSSITSERPRSAKRRTPIATEWNLRCEPRLKTGEPRHAYYLSLPAVSLDPLFLSPLHLSVSPFVPSGGGLGGRWRGSQSNRSGPPAAQPRDFTRARHPARAISRARRDSRNASERDQKFDSRSGSGAAAGRHGRVQVSLSSCATAVFTPNCCRRHKSATPSWAN